MTDTPVRVLTINAGSSSVRLAAFDRGCHLLAETHLDKPAIDPETVITGFCREHRLGDPESAIHRVVHGGTRLTAPCRIDPGIEHEIAHLAGLAPLHNPVALAWIEAVRRQFGPALPQFAVFDTGFFAALPEAARRYALPAALAARLEIRRYGFHGIAHEAMWRAWTGSRPLSGGRRRVISLQLGAGCSISAIEDGATRDTSMGFSPLEGLVMATRCGDLDPGALLYLQRAAGLDAAAAEHLLNSQSGLLGLSGISGDMRELLDSKEPEAQLAVDVYCRRARKYVGGYLALLGGAEAILFGGGVGENAAAIRASILTGMDWAGIRLDEHRNREARGATRRISQDDSRVEIWTIAVNEAAIMAERGLDLLARCAATGTEGIS